MVKKNPKMCKNPNKSQKNEIIKKKSQKNSQKNSKNYKYQKTKKN